jgi:hypothetical protein
MSKRSNASAHRPAGPPCRDALGHAIVGVLAALALLALASAELAHPPTARNSIAHAGQPLDALPRPASSSLQAGLDQAPVRASQSRREDDQMDGHAPWPQSPESQALMRFLEVLRTTTDPNLTALLAGAPAELRVMCDMELFIHHLHVTDDVREHIVDALDVPDLREQFEKYKLEPHSNEMSQLFDRALTPHGLRYVERTRREPPWQISPEGKF